MYVSCHVLHLMNVILQVQVTFRVEADDLYTLRVSDSWNKFVTLSIDI